MAERWLDYGEFRRRLYRSTCYQGEMPDEFFRSRPLPTLRWDVPGLASFASPCRRRPGPPVYGPPSRWLLADASSARLLIYGRTDAYSFTTHSLQPFTAEATSGSLGDARARAARIDELLESLIFQFFDATPGDTARRKELGDLLAAENPGALLDWHRELVPDFFAWLGA